LLSTAIAYSKAFFSVDPRVVLVIGYIVEVRFHYPICNSGVVDNVERFLIHDSFSSNLQQKIEHNFFVATNRTLISFCFLPSEDNRKVKKSEK